MELNATQAPQESPAPATPAPTGPSDEARLAVIARKERELQQQQAKLKDAVSVSELKNLLKSDKSEFFKKLGISETDLTTQPEPEAEDPIARLRAELDELRNKDAHRETEAFKADIKKALEAGGEEFELVNALGGVDDVYGLIEAHYQETGEVLDVKEAAAKLETYLLEQAKKLVKAQKLKGLLTPENAAKEQNSGEKRPAPTLNPSLASPAAQPRTFDSRTIEESKRRAAQLIKWD